MLPLSIGRTSSFARGQRHVPRSLAWLRPANIAAGVTLQRRVLVVWLATFVALAVAIGLAHVWLRLQVVDLGYRLSATRQVIEKLELEAHDLALEAATLEAPDRLETVARQRLGMVRPEPGQEVVLP